MNDKSLHLSVTGIFTILMALLSGSVYGFQHAPYIYYTAPAWYQGGPENRFKDPDSVGSTDLQTHVWHCYVFSHTAYNPGQPPQIRPAWDVYYYNDCASPYPMTGPWRMEGAVVRYAKCPGQPRVQIGINSTYTCNTTGGVNELKRGSSPLSCPAGNPVNVAAKDKYMNRTEFTGSGVFPVTFTWVYNFRDYSSSYADAKVLGHKRTHNYNNRIDVKSVDTGTGAVTTAFVSRADNTTQLFNYNSATDQWESTGDIRAALTQLKDGAGVVTGWEYVTADNITETYDVAGLLQSVEDLAGNVHTLTYQQGYLDEVTSNSGDKITFQYDSSGRISSLTHPDSGRVWGFRYTSNGTGGLLKYVDNPDGTTRRYHYNEPDMTDGLNITSALTGITDERGVRYANYEYDLFDTGEGTVAIASYHGPKTNILTGRIDGVSITYNGNTRTVTNSNGSNTSYTRDVKQGVEFIKHVSGPGCASCQGGTISYNYDPITLDLLSRTDNGITTEYGNYDSHGYPGYITKAKGTAEERRIDYTYHPDYAGKIGTITEPSVHAGSNKVTTYTYDDFGNRRSETVDGYAPDGAGGWSAISRTTSYRYGGPDPIDCPESEVPYHQICEIDGPRTDVSDITTLRYYADDPNEGDNRARLKEIEDATGSLLRSNVQYSSTGRVLSEDRPNGLSLTFSYYAGNDRLETLTESATVGARTTRWTYLATGEVESIIQADNSPAATTLSFTYDDARRLTRITDGPGNYLDFVLDTEGNVVSQNTHDSTGTLLKAVNQAFDTYNRLDVISQANEIADYDFAPDGTLDMQTDGYGSITDYDYDALERLIQTTRDRGGSTPGTADSVTRYGYDAGDRLIQVVDPNNGTTTYVYDDLGNRLSQTSPDTGVTTYIYDEAGNVKTRTTAADTGEAVTLTYSYDALNRLTAVTTPDPLEDITYHYDSCTNGMGRLCAVTNGHATAAYAYDPFGNVTTHQGLTYTYDLANRVKSLTYPSGARLTYGYDAAGQLSGVDLTVNGQTESLAAGITYAPFGGIENLSYGNGQGLTQGFDSAYRQTAQVIPGVLGLGYTLYDSNGNLKTRTDTLSSTSSFAYDALDRLDTAGGSFGSGWNYKYDRNGNRTLREEGGPVPLTYEANSNRLDSIGSDDVILDIAGNMLANGSWTYRYTPHYRLMEANDGTGVIATFSYNGLGQRVSKTRASGGTLRFVYGLDGALMAEEDATGAVLKEYLYLNGTLLAVLDHDSDSDGIADVNDNCINAANNPDAGGNVQRDTDGDGYGNMCDADRDGSGLVNIFDLFLFKQLFATTDPHADLDGSGLVNIFDLFLFKQLFATAPGPSGPNGEANPASVYYVHSDHLGTPLVMTDEAGAVVWRAEYDPFGKAAVDEDPDGNGMAVTLNARFPGQYYDVETGLHYNYFRYYDPSTGRYMTSDPVGLSGGLNTYSYALNNPLYWSDPLGLDVLVTLYKGQNGNVFNHIGIGTTSGPNAKQTFGLAPNSGIGLFSPVPGHLSIDGGEPLATLTISATPEQDALVNTYNDTASNNPDARYSLLWDSCVDHVRGALSAGGIGIPTPVVGSGRNKRRSMQGQNTNLPNTIFKALSPLGAVVYH